MKESEVNKSIKRNLRLFCPQVVVLIRIFTGSIEVKWGGWVHGASPGTADWVAIVNNKGVAHTLFIEAKRSRGGVHSDEQKEFQHKFDGIENVHYIVARSVHDVINYVKKLVDI